MPDTIRLAAFCVGAALTTIPLARAQTALRLEGTCERLVVAGRDLTASCAAILTNGVSRGRASFDFTAAGGEGVSFTGNGAQQEATEETDPLQPINAVVEAKGGTPILAVGTCRFSTAQPGRTAITCEANAPDGRTYAGTFVTAARAAAPAPAR